MYVCMQAFVYMCKCVQGYVCEIISMDMNVSVLCGGMRVWAGVYIYVCVCAFVHEYCVSAGVCMWTQLFIYAWCVWMYVREKG